MNTRSGGYPDLKAIKGESSQSFAGGDFEWLDLYRRSGPWFLR
jgi:hypothetical protein